LSNAATASERWFDEYLATNGYTAQVEPDLGVRTRPDRLIERVGVEAICEVKEFTRDAMNRRWPEGGSQIGSFSSEEWLLNVRRAISSAARQLAPLAGDKRPLVIVLANPHGVIAHLKGPDLMEAMQGDLMITFKLNTETGEPASEPEWALGEGGRLAGERAPWVSAVAGLHRGDRQRDWMQKWIDDWKAENWPEGPSSEDDALARFLAYQEELEQALEREDVPSGEYFYLHVAEAISEEAVPLPRNIFDAELDRRWVVNRDAGAYELLA
jgi:hypothetical protein